MGGSTWQRARTYMLVLPVTDYRRSSVCGYCETVCALLATEALSSHLQGLFVRLEQQSCVMQVIVSRFQVALRS